MSGHGRSKILSRIGFIAFFCFMMSMAVVSDAYAAKVKTKITMRVGQKLQLTVKGAPENLNWKITSGNWRVKKNTKTNGLFKTKSTGKVIIKTVYNNYTYVFKINIKKKKAGQGKYVNVLASPEGSTVTKSNSSKVVIPKTGIQTKSLGVKYAENQLIIVGDSRCVGMKSVVGGSAAWYAQTSMGLTWLQDTVWKKTWKKLKKLDVKGKVVIFNLGVNDLGNASSYVTTLNTYGEKIRENGGAVYFMTVNPVDETLEAKHGYSVKNSSIVAFNQTLASGLSGFGIISTYDYLVDNGFDTVDGVHYMSTTYSTIYSILKSVLVQ